MPGVFSALSCVSLTQFFSIMGLPITGQVCSIMDTFRPVLTFAQPYNLVSMGFYLGKSLLERC